MTIHLHHGMAADLSLATEIGETSPLGVAEARDKEKLADILLEG